MHNLWHFTGTETWHRHWLRWLLYTDGVEYFAEKAGAYWFIDEVAIRFKELQAIEPFIHVVLRVEDSAATIRLDDGNGRTLADVEIAYTDCPEGVWKFYLADSVLMLPTEY